MSATGHAHEMAKLRWDKLDKPPKNVIAVIKWWLSYSPRLKYLIAIIGEQVIQRDEKALVFFANPFEQQVLVAMLRVVGIKAIAVLSGPKHGHLKTAEQHTSFKRPLHRTLHPHNPMPKAGETEVLVQSYNKAAGSNLHFLCFWSHLRSLMYVIWCCGVSGIT